MKLYLFPILVALSTQAFAQNCQVKLDGCGGKYPYYTGTYDTCNYDRNSKIRIPVIFHVVYRNAEQTFHPT